MKNTWTPQMTCFNTLGRLVGERMHAFSFGRPQNWANFKGPHKVFKS